MFIRKMRHARQTVTFVLVGVVVSLFLAGCSSSEEKPKAENGGTYYMGPLQKGKKTAQ